MAPPTSCKALTGVLLIAAGGGRLHSDALHEHAGEQITNLKTAMGRQ